MSPSSNQFLALAIEDESVHHSTSSAVTKDNVTNIKEVPTKGDASKWSDESLSDEGSDIVSVNNSSDHFKPSPVNMPTSPVDMPPSPPNARYASSMFYQPNYHPNFHPNYVNNAHAQQPVQASMQAAIQAANAQIAQLVERQSMLQSQLQALTMGFPQDRCLYDSHFRPATPFMPPPCIVPIPKKGPSPKDKKVVFSEALVKANKKATKKSEFTKFFDEAPDIPKEIVATLVDICVECYLDKDKVEVLNNMFKNGLNWYSSTASDKLNTCSVVDNSQTAPAISHIEEMSDA